MREGKLLGEVLSFNVATFNGTLIIETVIPRHRLRPTFTTLPLE